MGWASFAVLALTAGLQFGTGAAQSSVKCVAFASSKSKSYSKSAFVSLGAKIASELCSKTAAKASIEIHVETVAQAFALAVAETSVSCNAVGNAKGTASAYAKAEAQAEATAAALLEGWVSVKTCNGCKAAAELFLESWDSALAHAVAESKSQVDVNASKLGRDKKAKKDVVKKIENIILPVSSKLTASISTELEKDKETCSVFISGCTVAGKEGGCCNLKSTNVAKKIETDAIASAAVLAEAEALKCDKSNDLEATAYVVAKAMAKAYAEAVVTVDAYCDATENSSACIWAESSQTTMAEAQAKAFAAAWAKADNACGCKISLDATANAVKNIYAKATSEVLVAVCSEGDGLAGVEAVAKAYDEKTVEAVAAVLASAVADGEGCGGVVSACAQTGDNHACCDLLVDSRASTFQKNAMAEAGAGAALYTCDGDGEAEAKTHAEAIAVAWAKVLTEIDSYCDSSGHANACSVAEASIKAAAKAQAKAYADAWAGTLGDKCDCELQIDAAVESIVKVLVEVTLDVHESVCVSGGAYYSHSDLIEVFKGAHITAIANALASIKKTGTTCEALVAVDTEVKVCPNCVAKKGCAVYEGRGKNKKWVVKGCCDPKLECRQKFGRLGKVKGVCKPVGWVPPPRKAAKWGDEVYKC